MKIAMLLSGGVDSSVALNRLVDEYPKSVTAFYLKIWLEDELSFLGSCPWEEDLKYARQVCEQLNVPLQVVSLQTAYYERIVAYTISALKRGLTPSPDVFCNQKVKFGAFHEAVGAEYDRIASGHYAGTTYDGDLAWLVRAADPLKDQTYFLSHLRQDQLQRCLFPLGSLQKAQVRQYAEDLGLATAKRPDSQGICFLGKIKYEDFVRSHLGEKIGNIVHLSTDKILGQHHGYWFHTIGQRKGLNLSGGPWFVQSKDAERNIIYVCHSEEVSLSKTFFLRNPHWITKKPAAGTYQFKLRHGQHEDCGELSLDATNGVWRVCAERGDAGIAPGQIAVFYEGNRCLGGGEISLDLARDGWWD